MDSAETSLYIDKIKSESNPFSQAKLIKFLIHEKGLRLKDISLKLEKKEAYVCHLLRLLKLPEIVIDGYYSSLLSLSHLFIISRLHATELMAEVYEMVLAKSLTVSQTEEVVREKLYGIKTDGDYLTSGVVDSLRPDNFIGEIRVLQSRIKSKIIIEIKGSLKDTAPRIKKILGKLKEVDEFGS